MLCPRCPYFQGDVPADVCARCSRGLRPRALLAAFALLLLSSAAGHTLTYFFTGTFWNWHTPAFAVANAPLQLPGDYRFPVDLSAFPAFGIALGLLYGIVAAVPALGASMLGLFGGVVLALASWTWAPAPWYPVLLLAGAVVAAPAGCLGTRSRGRGFLRGWSSAAGTSMPREAAPRRDGARWWQQRLALGVGLPVAFLVAAHVVSAARTHVLVHLLPGAVAVAGAAGLVFLWYREVRLRSLRLFPVTLATLFLFAASPLLFSLTVTFPYHSYQLLWDRFSVESLCGLSPGEGPSPAPVPEPAAPSGYSAHGPRPSTPAVTDLQDFAKRRTLAAARFGEFVRRYPGSPFAPEALLQQARLLNLRAAVTAEGTLRFREDRIAPEALPVYADLIKLAPASVAAARARLEGALWSLQNSRFDEAREKYRDILVTYETHVPPNYQPPAPLLLQGVCRQAGRPSSSREPGAHPFSAEETQVAYYEAYLTARQALAFLAENGQFEAEPLRLFLRLAPNEADYGPRLAELLLLYPEDVYPDLGLLDDIQVALARGLPGEAQRLTQLLTRHRRGEGYARALYRLAELYFHRGDSPAAERCLSQLVEEAGRGAADPLSLEVVWAQALLRQRLEVPSPWPRPFP
jgi:tetratricopeptide (TPR) repeat protein